MENKNVLKKLRKKILYISLIGKDGNIQSCFSSLEIIWTIYSFFLSVGRTEHFSEGRNRFVLSKGQSNLAVMVVLAEKGVIEERELEKFCKFDSRISMQADRTKFSGIVETSAGSLGHGFPMAVGMAWAKKIKSEKGKIFCLAGDGEMNEGTMWEAAIFASSEKLNNLVLIVDDNSSISRLIDIGSLKDKFIAFGFIVSEVNGHDVEALKEVLELNFDKPHVVLAKTIRGWGSKTLIEDRSWFHRYPKEDEIELLCREVDDFEKDYARMCKKIYFK